DAGLEATAHFYIASMQWIGGRLEAVVTGKQLTPEQRGGIVEDVERGFSETLQPLPWHADTCLGDWHYSRPLYERHGYKSAQSVIQRLCDTVSKNGNLLLNVPVRGDGTIDDDEVAIVERIGEWTARNGAAIFGTRPWRVFGEGPTPVAGGAFGEEKAKAFTPADIRFTTRAGTLYALVLGEPADDRVTIASLATGGTVTSGEVRRVELLGGDGVPLHFDRTARGLTVTLPPRRPRPLVTALAIEGPGLVG
ncbi:MAG: alpha-L-fucosidase, partial [Gemmatimonadaceae bacterium]|nr:alpha-L-fucosidase [Gemmatimonadaceae bacterium]